MSTTTTTTLNMKYPGSGTTIHDPIIAMGISLTALSTAASPPTPEIALISQAVIINGGEEVGEAEIRASTGDGALNFPSRMKYEGGVVGGLREGVGTLTLPEGIRVTSDKWVQGEAQGFGTISWPDGSFYEGGLTGGMRDGLGVLRHAPSGSIYTGRWRMGSRHGRGVLKYRDGSIYSGDWMGDCDARGGIGTMVYATGAIYVGEWLKGKKSGVGIFISARLAEVGGREEYTGNWLSDTPHGAGTHTIYDVAGAVSSRYRGGFDMGARAGVGALTTAAGDSYTGGWSLNQKAGFGVYAAADGAVFDGVFVGDAPVASLATLLQSGAAHLNNKSRGGGRIDNTTSLSPSPSSSSIELPPGIVPPPPPPRRATLSCDAAFAGGSALAALFDLLPTDDALLSWEKRRVDAAAIAQLPFSLAPGMTVGNPPAARATAVRLRAQALERVSSVLLRWAPRIEAWYETYARLPLTAGEADYDIGCEVSAVYDFAQTAARAAIQAGLETESDSWVNGPPPPSPTFEDLTAILASAARAGGSIGVAGGVTPAAPATHGVAPAIMRLAHLWRFVRDTGLVAPPYVSLRSVGEALSRARAAHVRARIEAAGRILALDGALKAGADGVGASAARMGAANTAQVTGGASVAVAAIIADSLSSLSASSGISLNPLTTATSSSSFLSGNDDDHDGSLTTPTATTSTPFSGSGDGDGGASILHDPTQAVLLRDFVDVIVRLVLEKAFLECGSFSQAQTDVTGVGFSMTHSSSSVSTTAPPPSSSLPHEIASITNSGSAHFSDILTPPPSSTLKSAVNSNLSSIISPLPKKVPALPSQSTSLSSSTTTNIATTTTTTTTSATVAKNPHLLALGAAASSGASFYASSSASAGLSATLATLLPQSAAVALIPASAWGAAGVLAGGTGGSALATRAVGSGPLRVRIGDKPPNAFTTSNVALLASPTYSSVHDALREAHPDGAALAIDAAFHYMIAPHALAPPPALVLSSLPGPDAPPLARTTAAMIATIKAAASNGGSARSVALSDPSELEGGEGGLPTSSRLSAVFSVRTNRTLGGSGGPRRVKMDPDSAAAAAAASVPPVPLLPRDGLRRLPPTPLPLTSAALTATYNGGGALKKMRSAAVAFEASMGSANMSERASLSSSMSMLSNELIGSENEGVGGGGGGGVGGGVGSALDALLISGSRTSLSLNTIITTLSSDTLVDAASHSVMRDSLSGVYAALALLPPMVKEGEEGINHNKQNNATPTLALLSTVSPKIPSSNVVNRRGPVQVATLIRAFLSAALLEVSPFCLPASLVDLVLISPAAVAAALKQTKVDTAPLASAVVPVPEPSSKKPATPAKGVTKPPLVAAAAAATTTPLSPEPIAPVSGSPLSPHVLTALEASPVLSTFHAVVTSLLFSLPIVDMTAAVLLAASAADAEPLLPIDIIYRSGMDSETVHNTAEQKMGANGHWGGGSTTTRQTTSLTSPTAIEIRRSLVSCSHSILTPLSAEPLLSMDLVGPEISEAILRISAGLGAACAARPAALEKALIALDKATLIAMTTLNETYGSEAEAATTSSANRPKSRQRRDSSSGYAEILEAGVNIIAVTHARTGAALRLAALQGLCDATDSSGDGGGINVCGIHIAALPNWTYTGPSVPKPRASILRNNTGGTGPTPLQAATVYFPVVLDALQFSLSNVMNSDDIPVSAIACIDDLTTVIR